MAEEDPRERRPIPLIIWLALGFLAMLGFMFALRAANPPGAGTGPPTPDVIVPTAPKPAPLPDVKPAT